MSNYKKKRKSYGGGSSSKTNTPSIPLGQKDSKKQRALLKPFGQVVQEAKEIWNKLANKYSINIEHYGIPSLAGFNFKYKNHIKYKTLLTQEMLKEGFLASNICYSCLPHTKEILDLYSEKLDKVFFMHPII